MKKITVNYKIIFNDGNHRYISENPGIVSSYFSLLRHEDIDIVIKTFRDFSQGKFIFNFNDKTTTSDLINRIYEQIKFDSSIFDCNYSPIFIYAKSIYININPTNYLLNDLLSKYNIQNTINIYLEFSSSAGNIFYENGIRYYMHSNEQCRHSDPHIHIEYNDYQATMNLRTDEITGYLPNKIKKKAIQKIKSNIKALLTFWNEHTNGLKVDVDMFLNENKLDILNK